MPTPLRVTLTLALVAAVTGCEDYRPGLNRDPVASAAELAELPAARGTSASAPTPVQAAARRARAAKGFIRRGSVVPIRESNIVPARSTGGAGEISLDFQGADLASVVQVLMEDGLGATYVLSPEVTGTVTLRTNRPLRQSEILPTLEEILRLNDAALVEQDGIFKILPRAEAGLAAPLVGFRNVTARGMTVRVTPLRFVTVDEIAEVLDGFAPVAGSIRYDRARNLVFTVGTAPEQNTIMDVLSTLDVNFFAGRSFAMQPLRDAAPQPVVDELELLFQTPQGGPNPAIRFLAIERINAVLVISEDPSLLDEALKLVKFLDQGTGETPTLHVFSVENRRASDLALILGDLFDVSVSSFEGTSPVAPGLTTASGTTGFNQTPEGTTDGAAAAEDAVPVDPANTGLPRQAVFPSGAGAIGDGSGRAGVSRIVADESSNAIVALATADGADELEAALRRLDVQPLQVMIEATLLEVSLNDQLEFGVRWFIENGNFSGGFTDPPSSFSLGGIAGFFPGFNAAFNTADINVTLNALDSITDVRLLSSPTLMVLDNQVARLQVGDQVPITTRAAQSTLDPEAPIVAETEFRDTGVILEIQPTVNAGGLVVLGIRQEVSDVVETAGEENPTFAQRVVESTIAVQSGDTIALAGLIEEDSSRGKDGIPVLSDLPGVGPLFGAQTTLAARTELVVLIRPIVVRNQTEAQQATQELRRKLRSLVSREDASRAAAIQ